MPPTTIKRNLSVPQAYEYARRRHLDGALEQAQEVYERILEVMPDHPGAATMLASVAYRHGAEDEGRVYVDRAIDLTRAAVQRDPADVGARAGLINLLLVRGRISEAETLVAELEIPLNPIRATPEEFAARREAGIARGLPTLAISTVPKSASESIWNKLAEGLGLAQCYLSLGLFPDCCLVPSRVREAAKGAVITKEHIAPSAHNLKVLAGAGYDRLVVHHRDPRQATLSWVHFARDDINKRLMAPLWRKIVPPAGVLAGPLEGRIDWAIERYLPLLVRFLADWRGADADPKLPLKVLFASFEDFRRDPMAYYRRVLDFYELPRAGFAAEAEAEVVHLRKGRIDEWREVFTPAQRARAWELMPSELAEAFGWQP